ncbi:MAG TPA: altronate dehydratase family protein [Chitinophagaceae bacterium]|nr:altronate dehydratase family protein [Chitinophagaceae bacterium]
MNKTLKIHPSDNVDVALTNLQKGDVVNGYGEQIVLLENIPAKHKYAAKHFKEGDEIIMYGVLVGKAVHEIEKGALINTKNITHASGSFGLKERKTGWHKPDVAKWQNKKFMGYHRADGSVGVANHWVVIPLVFCENKNVEVLQEAFSKALGYEQKQSPYQAMVEKFAEMYTNGKNEDEIISAHFSLDEIDEKSAKVFQNIDGIKFLTHTLGCGGTRQDARALCGLLAGYITHANVAGATVLSLGCQNAQMSILQEEIAKRDPSFSKPLVLLEQQQVGSEQALLQEAIRQTFAGLMQANKLERKPAPISKLCIGLECGGSDGFSGISANPAIGYTSDILTALGGSVVLSEFPELCGVEQELSDRCVDEATAQRFMELMTTYNSRAMAVGSGFYANPSPGNIKDGLITDAIKSAGAAKKGGTSPVTDVLDYPEKITKPGLTLLCTPGSDVESTTAEVGSGATIVLFTTGLGTPTGNPVAPVLKLSSNTALYKKMTDIIDIDTGTIIDGSETIEQAGERILEYVVKVASGEVKAKADANKHDDFIPWKRGISL